MRIIAFIIAVILAALAAALFALYPLIGRRIGRRCWYLWHEQARDRIKMPKWQGYIFWPYWYISREIPIIDVFPPIHSLTRKKYINLMSVLWLPKFIWNVIECLVGGIFLVFVLLPLTIFLPTKMFSKGGRNG